MLHRLEPDPAILWAEARSDVALNDGVLVLDDSILDKPYASKIELVGRHWSGKHHGIVQGISLVSLLWTDGDRNPCGYGIYHQSIDRLTKNDHAQAMLQAKHGRCFQPKCIVFDGWHNRLENLKKS